MNISQLVEWLKSPQDPIQIIIETYFAFFSTNPSFDEMDILDELNMKIGHFHPEWDIPMYKLLATEIGVEAMVRQMLDKEDIQRYWKY